MPNTLRPTLQCFTGQFQRKAKHHFSTIIECDGNFYELKSSYTQKYPASLWQSVRLYFSIQRNTVKQTCENRARQICARTQTYCESTKYVTSVTRDKSCIQRHVTFVRIDGIELEKLLKEQHLRILIVDGELSRTEQAREAVLGLSAVMILKDPVSPAHRQAATS